MVWQYLKANYKMMINDAFNFFYITAFKKVLYVKWPSYEIINNPNRAIFHLIKRNSSTLIAVIFKDIIPVQRNLK